MDARRIATPRDLREALGPGGDLAQVKVLIAHLPRAVLVTDRSGRYVAVNRAACALTGYREEELLRMAFPDVTGQTDERIAETLWRVFVERGEQRGGFSLRRKDGSSLAVRYDAISIPPEFHASFLDAEDAGPPDVEA